MGSLLRFPLSDEIVARFPIFIETGYGDGRSLRYAADHSFDRLYSIELWRESYEKGVYEFSADPRVTLIHGESTPKLRSLLYTYNQSKGIFFWLDAHFPGTDYYSQPIDQEPNEAIRLPLINELRAITDYSYNFEYFILIDDLRFYADLDWGDGPVPDEFRHALPRRRGLDFLDNFRGNNRVEILIQDSVYAMIGPHDLTFPTFTD